MQNYKLISNLNFWSNETNLDFILKKKNIINESLLRTI